jgi:hypothetical protein
MIANLADYSIAFDLAREAAVEAEPLSAILGRVMSAILGTIPPDDCDPSELRAIRHGVADALNGRPCRTPRPVTSEGTRRQRPGRFGA